MLYLVDTNILLRFVDRTYPLHPSIRIAVRTLRQNGHQLQVTSQNCIEFWNVATGPLEKNGLTELFWITQNFELLVKR